MDNGVDDGPKLGAFGTGEAIAAWLGRPQEGARYYVLCVMLCYVMHVGGGVLCNGVLACGVKVIGLFEGQSFVPTYVGIDMLKKEGGIDRFLLGDGCNNVSSRRKHLIPESLTNILEKVCKKSEENGQK